MGIDILLHIWIYFAYRNYFFSIKIQETAMLDKVIEIIRNQLGIDDAEITEDTNFKDDLGVDSLDLLELVMAFEEEYNIELNPEELEDIQTVGDVMEFIRKYAD